jgi:hypothetical protein
MYFVDKDIIYRNDIVVFTKNANKKKTDNDEWNSTLTDPCCAVGTNHYHTTITHHIPSSDTPHSKFGCTGRIERNVVSVTSKSVVSVTSNQNTADIGVYYQESQTVIILIQKKYLRTE